MKITKEDVLKIEHEIIGENTPWEKFDDNDYLAYLAIYTDGVNTMANTIIRTLEGQAPEHSLILIKRLLLTSVAMH